MKKRTCTKKVFTKRSIGLAFMLSAAFSLLLMPINAQALVRSAFNASLLANRDSIVLDPGEFWYDETLHHQAISPVDSSRVIACNSNGGNITFRKNHYGLHNQPEINSSCGIGRHAWSFDFEWHANKQAYAVENEVPYIEGNKHSDQHELKFEKCLIAWWNLSGKKTTDGTKIQAWIDGDKKAENLFWVSYNTLTGHYRLWSALAGKPIGYTADDSMNLRLINQSDTTAIMYFDMHEISESDI